MVKSPMKLKAYNIGVSKVMEPFCIVKDQLKTLIAEGMATSMLINENTRAE